MTQGQESHNEQKQLGHGHRASAEVTGENTRGARHTERCCLRPSLYQAADQGWSVGSGRPEWEAEAL